MEIRRLPDFCLSILGAVRSRSVFGFSRCIIYRWKGLGEGNPTSSRVKESEQYSWRTWEISVFLCFSHGKGYVYVVCWCGSGCSGLFCVREVKGIWFLIFFFIYLFWYKRVHRLGSSPLWIRTLASQINITLHLIKSLLSVLKSLSWPLIIQSLRVCTWYLDRSSV